METVLVTGGAGFIGSHLVERLLGRGDRVIVLDDFSTGARENLPDEHPRLLTLHGSVLDIGCWRQELMEVTSVVHLAALISAYDSQSEPDRYFETNVTGLLRLIDVLRALKRPRLLFASTSGVYGNGAEPRRSEEQVPDPATVYAVTKLAGESLLATYREKAGFDDVSFRLFNVYGPKQKRDHPYANVTCKFSWAAATGSPVILYGDGQQTRDFVYVDDVVDVFVAALERRPPQRIYNVGTGQQYSIASLLELVQSLAVRRVDVSQAPPWPNDIRAIVADVSRMEADFGFGPKITLEEGLRRTINYFRGLAGG